MHGVKRLFSWMIPRFDRDRFNVSLVSLRKKDLSEETLEALGIDITYLGRGKFDPLTLPSCFVSSMPSGSTSCTCTAMARRLRSRRGGAAGPSDHPPRAREPDGYPLVSEGGGSAARAGDRHRARGLADHGRLCRRRAQDPGVEGEGRLPRRPHGGVQPRAERRGDSCRPARAGNRHRRVRRRYRHPASRFQGKLVSRRGGCPRRPRSARHPVLPRWRRALAVRPAGSGHRAGAWRSVRVRRFAAMWRHAVGSI